MLESRKLPRRSMSLQDRVNKSDAEDKSLSNDETPLPTCPRQPPDGVETPCDAVEKIPNPPSRLPPRLPVGWPSTRSRFSYSSRTQDARSEASVKDKIAMFSNDSTSTDRIDKCGTLPTRSSAVTRKSSNSFTPNYHEVSSLDRRLTKSQDNLDEVPRVYKRHTDRPEVLGSLEKTRDKSIATSSKPSRTSNLENKPLFYRSTTTLPSSVNTSFGQPIYHARSVSDDNGNKKNHKSNLEYLIEQRKKSMSKLRGLVIPEVQGPIVDLPEIKVQDSFSKSLLLKSNHNNVNRKENLTKNIKPVVSLENKWKDNLLSNNIPKYSPAFKRKSLQVYTPTSLSKESTPERTERKFNEKFDSLCRVQNNAHTLKPLKNAIDHKVPIEKSSTSTLPPKFFSSISNKQVSNKDYKDILSNVADYKNVEIKICTATDVLDSDNDSAMSSTQSSYRSSASSPMHNADTMESDSSRLSPRISHYSSYSLTKSEQPTKPVSTDKAENYVKRNVCRSVSSETNVSLSSSAGSGATSGSQASCSSLESTVADSEKRKVAKTYDMDTINRRNILASAKCRSGRDAKLNSPVVETKFSHESCDRSSSPTHKTSDRLSTLTSSVSAISNKGDSRRRNNKKVAESDTDSDSEVNIRQRKIVNTRLKRNSSAKKQNEVNLDNSKVEDAPKQISEKIIKEIKKAGLENYTTNKLLLTKNNVDSKKAEKKIIPKDEKNMKCENIVIQSIDVVDNSKPNLVDVKKEHIITKDDVAKRKLPTKLIHLKRGNSSGVGLILAGGVDCEAKDVTVHRVLDDSIAAKAGLKRGVKVRSINGCNMAGLTHAQSVTILKEQRSEILIEIEHEAPENQDSVQCGFESAESKVRQVKGEVKDNKETKSSVVTVLLEKAGGGAGLGFGLDGGRDSPQGDRPLTIKKLFAGGAAAQSGRVLVGAELLSAGGQSMEGFTRTQAWAALKSLPAGPVALKLKNPTS